MPAPLAIMIRYDLSHSITAALERSCSEEPIHLLNTVQPYGFLMVVNPDDQRIVSVSSGITRHWPGLQDASSVIGELLSDWVGGREIINALALQSLPWSNPVIRSWCPRFARTSPETGDTLASAWECLGHRSGEWAVLEWLPLATDTAELLRQSRVLSDIAGVIARLRRPDRLDTFFNECVEVMQQISGFDRVMIYRFLADGCGEVIAEHTIGTLGKKFLGLRFPATDIPSQARTLYLENRLRVLADAHAPMDTLIPSKLPTGAQLDESHCVLRGLSPVHLSYLTNMGVRATLTLSIVSEGRLWGLIACHHHEPKVPPHQVREGLRQVCELVAEVTNMRVDALSQLEAVRRRQASDRELSQLNQALMLGRDIPTVLDAHLPEILKLFDAECLGLRIGNCVYLGGTARQCGPAEQILDEVGTHLESLHDGPRGLIRDDLLSNGNQGLASLPDAAGLLAAQLVEEEPAYCFVTRPEVVQQLRWGGMPSKEMVSLPDGRVRLEPRRSFAVWQQSVKGRSQPWEAANIETLQSLLKMLSEANKLYVNRELQQTLHWRAHHDQLTGLYNRRAMESEVSRRMKEKPSGAALMLLDMDHFKQINDTYGHETGDLVLQELSTRLRAAVRGFDLIGRLGGDEFLLLLEIEDCGPAKALVFAERLHHAAAAPFNVSGQRLRLEISVGIAIPPEHGQTVGELLRHADLALYQAKGRGRSRSVVFEPSMESDQRDSYLLERDLNEAIERNELSLVFQPKVDLISRCVVGLEALVRWNHPTRGQNNPDSFIPIAERSEQIVRIDRWVMRAAVGQMALWRLEGQARLPVAINLSMSDILSSNLLGFLQQLLEDYQLPADALEVEVTESCIMRDLDQTRSVLASLNQYGISTTLDDFGTGFSSLSYLRQLPLQCLKIDQSFVRSMLQDPNTEKLTQAILVMGGALQMKIVAEGVETEEQMDWLLSHGCQIGQGYFFSPPVPPEDVHSAIERIEHRLGPPRQPILAQLGPP